MKGKLETVDAQWLLEQPFAEPVWVVEDLLPAGLNLLVGAPKIGKSWLVLDLGLAVSAGNPFWGFATRSCEVLYLCLEDTYNRIQQRLWKLTDEANRRLRFAVDSGKIADGLVDELVDFVSDHPDTRLIIIDTFQVIRQPVHSNAYAADYDDMTELKEFADARGIALLVIHHTRKLGDSDVFNTVSGTNGIMGSADSTLILTKQSRGSSYGTLSATGRDINLMELKLRFHDCHWELVEKTSADELEEHEVPDSVLQIIDFMAAHPEDWHGTATALMAEAGIDTVTVAVLGKQLAQNRGYMADRGIAFDRKHTRGGNILQLVHSDRREGGEGCES